MSPCVCVCWIAAVCVCGWVCAQATNISACDCTSVLQMKSPDGSRCISCGEGERAFVASGTCGKCPAGRFQKSSGHIDTCGACDAGFYASSEGAAECTKCGTGMTTRPRFTEDGCECKKSWLLSVGGELEKVDSYCGNPDNSPRDWCFKLDASCGDYNWAYCAKGVYCAFESLLCVLPNRNTTCRGFTHRGLGRHGFLGCWVPS